MLTRHMNELNARLEQVNELGCAVIRKKELLRWHDKERMTKSVWRSVYDKWIEINSEAPIFVGDGDGIVTFIEGENLKIIDDEGWWEDLSKLAGVE